MFCDFYPTVARKHNKYHHLMEVDALNIILIIFQKRKVTTNNKILTRGEQYIYLYFKSYTLESIHINLVNFYFMILN